MGQKVNPISFRTGEFFDWKARWFAGKSGFSQYLLADLKLRRILGEKLKNAGVADILIERLPKTLNVRIFVTRPGLVIGRGGAGVEELRGLIRKTIANPPDKLDVAIEEVKEPELSAKLVASRIVQELQRRFPARRIATRAIERVLSAGAEGVKIVLSGRIGGAEIARREKFQAGSVPTQTLRANIDFDKQSALLKRGKVGVMVWIHRKKESHVAT